MGHYDSSELKRKVKRALHKVRKNYKEILLACVGIIVVKGRKEYVVHELRTELCIPEQELIGTEWFMSSQATYKPSPNNQAKPRLRAQPTNLNVASAAMSYPPPYNPLPPSSSPMTYPPTSASASSQPVPKSEWEYIGKAKEMLRRTVNESQERKMRMITVTIIAVMIMT
ncbi:hypothetical protein BDQ17DRAFT_1321002 [Cyathus striatus]|nr:hypothetical protein BDQ17DRAFT_1321002 [Cyathus striatus]